MSDFIVNESKFIVNMEEETDLYLQQGEILPDGIQISDLIENAATWQIYASEDNEKLILAVLPAMAERWIEDGYIQEKAIFWHESNGRKVALIISPSSLILHPITALRFENSQYYARSFYCALYNSRNINNSINLRDGIFVELYGVLLPTYSLTRPVADKAIFNNALGLNLEEDLSSPSDLEEPGVSYGYLISKLRDMKCKVNPSEPYLVAGERADEFLSLPEGTIITGPLVIQDNYQLYSTNSDKLVLLMENSFANEMVEKGIISILDLKSVQLGFGVLRAIILNRRFAAENLKDRHYGLTFASALKLASVIYKMRTNDVNADLKNGLYLEELRIILATDSSEDKNDAALMRDIITQGPFAFAPFSYDEIDALIALASVR